MTRKYNFRLNIFQCLSKHAQVIWFRSHHDLHCNKIDPHYPYHYVLTMFQQQSHLIQHKVLSESWPPPTFNCQAATFCSCCSSPHVCSWPRDTWKQKMIMIAQSTIIFSNLTFSFLIYSTSFLNCLACTVKKTAKAVTSSRFSSARPSGLSGSRWWPGPGRGTSGRGWRGTSQGL